MDELVSIITPLFNYEQYIGYAIESVVNQSYNNWEMIVVNDCSTDNSAEVVKRFADKDNRIHLINLDKNLGVANAKNVALQYVKGNLIAFLDSDDIWLKEKLEIQVEFMLKNNYPISFTSYELINKDGVKLNKIIYSKPCMGYRDYLKNTLIGFSTSMINKSIIKEFKFMNLLSREDTQLWINLLGKGFKAYGIPNVLVEYRTNHNSLSSNKYKAAKQVWNLYYRIEKLGLKHTIYYFSCYAFNALKKTGLFHKF